MKRVGKALVTPMDLNLCVGRDAGFTGHLLLGQCNICVYRQIYKLILKAHRNLSGLVRKELLPTKHFITTTALQI